MRTYHRFIAIVGLAALGLLVAACSGGDGPEKPTATPTGAAAPGSATAVATATTPATPAATPTALPEAATLDSLRAFAARVDDAFRGGDPAIVTARFQTSDVTCTAADVPSKIGGPACEKVGEQFKGFPIGRWRSEGTINKVDDATRIVTTFVTKVSPGGRDQHGLSAARVRGLGNDLAKPHILAIAITEEPTKPGSYRRAAIDFGVTFCQRDCPGGAGSRWVVTSMVTNYVLAEEWLGFSAEGEGFLRPFETLRRPLVLTPEIRQAAAEIAAQYGPAFKAIPDCTDEFACVTTDDPGVSVDLGVMRLGVNPKKGDVGAAAVFAGKGVDGLWHYWYATQNAVFRIADLPGDILVCADGEGLNIRSEPNTNSAVAGFVKDGARLTALSFLLTEPGNPGVNGKTGYGWYRVRAEGVSGWVYSKYITDARLKDCTYRNGIEKAG